MLLVGLEMVVAAQALNLIQETEQQENDAASSVDICWYFHVILPQHKLGAFLTETDNRNLKITESTIEQPPSMVISSQKKPVIV